MAITLLLVETKETRSKRFVLSDWVAFPGSVPAQEGHCLSALPFGLFTYVSGQALLRWTLSLSKDS